MKVPYYTKLKKIRAFYEKNLFDNPKGHCQKSARLLYLALGLEEVAGYYVHKGNHSWHAWSYDPKLKLYIDLTLDQFNDLPFNSTRGLTDSNHKPVSILSLNTKIVREKKEETEFQRDHKFNNINLEELVEKFQREYKANLR